MNILVFYPFQVLVFAVVAAFLLLISSALIADGVKGSGSFFDKLRAAAVSFNLACNVIIDILTIITWPRLRVC